jgi:soluble lytic murein transglycosylase-like protein
MNPFLLMGILALSIFGIVGLSGGSVNRKIKSPPNQEIADKINGYSIMMGIPASLVYGVVQAESDWQIDAENPADPSYGLMQITRPVFEDYGYQGLTVDQMKDPDLNLRVGIRYLANLIRRNGTVGGIQSYNVGEFGFRKFNHRNPVYLERVLRFAREYGFEETA